MGLLEKLQLKPETELESDPEIGPQFEMDPEPGEPSRPRRSSRKAPSAPTRRAPSNAKLAKQVAEDLTTLIELIAAGWSMTGDECCAPVLEQQAKPGADAIVSILARNPRMLEKFAGADLVSYSLQVAALGRAFAPVVKAVYRNHVSTTDEEGHPAHDNPNTVRLGAFPVYTPPSRTVPA